MIREWWSLRQIRKEVDKVSAEYRAAPKDHLKQSEKIMKQRMEEIRLKMSMASLQDDEEQLVSFQVAQRRTVERHEVKLEPVC
jgi:hypothetical protein